MEAVDGRAIADGPSFLSHFNDSESARLAVARAMGTEHETDHLTHYSNTLGLRPLGCFERDILAELLKRHLAGIHGQNGDRRLPWRRKSGCSHTRSLADNCRLKWNELWPDTSWRIWMNC